MDEPSFTLRIRDPWTMPYLDTADFLIDALKKQIGPKHPLYGREVFPSALRRDPDAIIFETDDEPRIYALVYMSWDAQTLARPRRLSRKTEMLADREAFQAQMDSDHVEWKAQFL